MTSVPSTPFIQKSFCNSAKSMKMCQALACPPARSQIRCRHQQATQWRPRSQIKTTARTRASTLRLLTKDGTLRIWIGSPQETEVLSPQAVVILIPRPRSKTLPPGVARWALWDQSVVLSPRVPPRFANYSAMFKICECRTTMRTTAVAS